MRLLSPFAYAAGEQSNFARLAASETLIPNQVIEPTAFNIPTVQTPETTFSSSKPETGTVFNPGGAAPPISLTSVPANSTAAVNDMTQVANNKFVVEAILGGLNTVKEIVKPQLPKNNPQPPINNNNSAVVKPNFFTKKNIIIGATILVIGTGIIFYIKHKNK